MSTFNIGDPIQTARINELPLFSSFGPLTTTDWFAVWLSAFNKTCKIDTQSLYNYMQSGGGGTLPPPVILGADFIHEVTSGEAGGTTVNIPTIAGESFFLERDGYPLKITDEFEILSGGGFNLTTPGDVLIEGQRFHIHLYSLAGGAPGPTTTTSFITGVVDIPINTTFDTVNDVNKLIRFRSGATKVTLTLPLIADIPENLIIPIEATINNTVENRITTQGGQLIYLNNVSKTSIYLRPGEVVWLYRGDDGYYVINDYAKILKDLAKPYATYKVGLGEILCNGQLLLRADYPRLFEEVQTLGASLVSDATWLTASAVNGAGATVSNPYRGCFSNGDGVTNFRVPDLMNTFLRSVKTESGSDTERILNKPGGYQQATIKVADTAVRGVKVTGSNTIAGTVDSINPGGQEFSLTQVFPIETGIETRPENVGVLWVIKC